MASWHNLTSPTVSGRTSTISKGIWERKWELAVGSNWQLHALYAFVFLLITYELSRVDASSHIWAPIISHVPQKGLGAEVFVLAAILLWSVPGHLSCLYAFLWVAASPFLFLVYLSFRYQPGHRRANPDWSRCVFDFTPQGRPTGVFLWLFWPLALFQMVLAGIAMVVSLVTGGLAVTMRLSELTVQVARARSKSLPRRAGPNRSRTRPPRRP